MGGTRMMYILGIQNLFKYAILEFNKFFIKFCFYYLPSSASLRPIDRKIFQVEFQTGSLSQTHIREK